MGRIKKISGFLAVILILSLALAGCAGGTSSSGSNQSASSAPAATAPAESQTATAPAEPVKGDLANVKPVDLVFHHHEPASAVTNQYFEKWVSEVKEASDGLLNITLYPGGILGTQKDTYDMLKNGSCDIAWGTQNAAQGSFPMSETFTLPLLGFRSNQAASAAIWALYNETNYMEKEYEPFHVLALHTCGEAALGLSKDMQINSISNMKDLKIRTSGTWVAQFYTNCGATPANIAAGEVYTSLEKNLLDGVAGDWNLSKSFKLYEQCPVWYEMLLICSPGYVMMNKDSYNSLPDELKTILDECAGDNLAKGCADTWSSTKQFCMEEIGKLGGKIVQPSDQLLSEMTPIAEKLWGDWVAKYSADGLPAQEALDFVREYLANWKG